MANSFYTALATTALNLIRDKGQKIKLRSKTQDFDPVTGENTGAAEITEGIFDAVKVSPAREDGVWFEDLVSGKAVKFLIAAKGAPFEPREGLQLVGYESGTWEISGVRKVNPADVTLLFYIYAKRGGAD